MKEKRQRSMTLKVMCSVGGLVFIFWYLHHVFRVLEMKMLTTPKVLGRSNKTTAFCLWSHHFFSILWKNASKFIHICNIMFMYGE